MITYDEVKAELETFEHDFPDEDERRETIIDYIMQVHDEAFCPSGEPVRPPKYNAVDETEFTIKVHEAMACATGEVLAQYLPQGDIEKLILKMAPHVSKWLLEDFNVSEKE